MPPSVFRAVVLRRWNSGMSKQRSQFTWFRQELFPISSSTYGNFLASCLSMLVFFSDSGMLCHLSKCEVKISWLNIYTTIVLANG